MKRYILFVMLCFNIVIAFSQQGNNHLEVIEYESPIKSSHGNSIITIVKINPEHFTFDIVGGKYLTAEEWSDQKGYVAVINAGMFDINHKNLGFMMNFDVSYNSKLNKDNAILALNPKDNTVPTAQIIDLKHQDWDVLKDKYYSFTQSIRMVDINGYNKWTLHELKWSTSAVAIDKDGNLLFIHSRSPYQVHVFINILLESPFNIKNMMYLEGGPEASLFVNYNGTIVRKVGSYETNFNENDNNNQFWVIPNIIGVKQK